MKDMLEGKKILLGVTGSIAAYKSAILVRLLVTRGAQVRVVMTASAGQFITPLTLSTLSGSSVHHGLTEQGVWNNHVRLARWADIFVVAPASANTLAKMAHGICDNLITAVFLSCSSPVVFAPAMDEDMWLHPAVQGNVKRLSGRKNIFLPVGHGPLASGLTGEGRMAEPEVIVRWLEEHFSSGQSFIHGKTVLVTAGPTHEPIDPVRFIANRSSGRMGIAIAEAFSGRGAKVELVLGPSSLVSHKQGIRVTRVETAEEMREACLRLASLSDIIVMAAAVSDFRTAGKSEKKIKKSGSSLTLELEKTPDILAELGANKKADQILVGFSLETDHEAEFAMKKLQEKNLDLIVLNSLKDEGAGFGTLTNKITVFRKDGERFHFELKSKVEVAADIVKAIIDLNHARQVS
jgi:phosphopantothenoylcysteine decarboxylase/phosphopantothenate--cysteine ligase